MIKIKINNHESLVSPNQTILDAAKQLNITIPTLCYLNGFERYSSCMICAVHNILTDKLVPSCSAPIRRPYEFLEVPRLSNISLINS